MSENVEHLVVRDKSSGRFHEAIRPMGKEPMLHDACNVIGDREYLEELPEDVEDHLLCKRCFGGREGPE